MVNQTPGQFFFCTALNDGLLQLEFFLTTS